ncbi:RNA pseudouridylate synthase domain-containing protein 1-like [Diaphorina citri]|uniref:RNA pseudouridylate synthase domain-containing protein 1-like n=1 Tax=Diaphorina citri TaxID=121845 RepID=A0A1S3DBI3_DIACI|nr:RNA pseudouridylate synthase domain-containing protein 1-like [Diaphorina citri]
MIPFFHVVHKYLLTWAHFLQSIFIIRKKLKPNNQLIEVLHQNDNYLVVNKPYDLLINSDESDKEDTLHLRLEEQFPTLVCKDVKFSFYFPHRLDYSTSGLMVLALNKTACSLMASCFEKKKVKKYYLALVRGTVSEEVIDVHHSIGYNVQELNRSNSMCSPEFNPVCTHARSAHTRLVVLSYGLYNSQPCTKVLVRIFTGRRHQIRVHCSNLGHTIVGDYTYSQRKDVGPPRQMLHAYRLKVDSIPNFDFRTSDPFDSTVLKDWEETQTVNDMNEEVFSKIDKT